MLAKLPLEGPFRPPRRLRARRFRLAAAGLLLTTFFASCVLIVALLARLL